VTDTLVTPDKIKDWQPNLPTSISPEQYLWTRTTIDYTSGDDSVSYTYSYQGKTGQAGSSVTVQKIEYLQGDNATTPPTGTWSTSIPTVAQGKYLWSKTTFSDGKVAYGISYQSKDGTHAQDFNITADSYVLKKSSPTATTYTNTITLTARKMNITGNVKWYKDNTSTSSLKTGDTYNPTTPGTYWAVCGTWKDSVVIGEVADGATGPDGKPAISIVLSNPTMTFHAQTNNESEICEVIVYEGSTKLTTTATSGARFSVSKKADANNKASINGAKVTISDPESDGYCTI
jgi:hypothetical protein